MIDHEELKNRLLAIAPELEASVAEWCESFEDYNPSAMIFFDDHLDPYLANVLESGAQDDHCRELFDFFEELANSTDEEVVSCVAYALPRALQAHSDAVRRADEFLGPKSRELTLEYLLTYTTWTKRKLRWRRAL